MMRKLVQTAPQVAANVRRFADEIAGSSELQSKLGQVHAWYAVRLPEGGWAFGSSKFVGYQNNNARLYLDTYLAEADGRQTEHALKSLTSEVRPDSSLGRELAAALADFLHRFGRRPRSGARFRIVTDEPAPELIPNRTSDELLGRITSDPNICGGRPCIRGTRMRVIDIVAALAHGMSRDELLHDFDYLTREDIAAALLFAARASDHRVILTA